VIEFDDERHDPECATRTKKRDWRCDCSREALKARVKELESALRLVLDSAHPNPTHHPTMTAAWAHATRALEKS
jgi:hypothetical protein